jgi:hypothetical protein
MLAKYLWDKQIKKEKMSGKMIRKEKVANECNSSVGNAKGMRSLGKQA